MNIGVFWRKYRNIEFQSKINPNILEHDSYQEALSHSEDLREAGYNTLLIEWDDNPLEIYKLLKEQEIDLVFNASSEKELNFLDTFNFPYTGSSLATVGLNKAFRKMIVSHHNIITPKFALAESVYRIPNIDFRYPIFVKPLEGRGSMGIDDSNIVDSLEELPKVIEKITKKVGQVALIEEFIEGREITVGIIGFKTPEILPIAEIVYNNSRTNTYNHKKNDDETIICPAKLPKEVEKLINKDVLKIYKVLNIYDYGRVDFILDKNNVPYFLEINTFPGIIMPDDDREKRSHYGYMGYMAKAIGYSRSGFLKKIVESTIERYGLTNK